MARQPACQAHAALVPHCRITWRLAPAGRTGQRRHHRLRLAAAAQGPSEGQPQDQQPKGNPDLSVDQADLNQLQTALNTAIAAEDWQAAAKLRDQLRQVVGSEGQTAADWKALGVLDWLADRAESLGFSFPTEVQKRAAPVIIDGGDCVINSVTGSGKTLSFLLPLLSRLSYPPATYPDDLKGPQALIVVPTRELGVQLVMLVYRLFGGSVNQGLPGLGGNMFDYHGPRGLKVRGLLLASEVASAKQDYYLKGAHVVVGTPELIAEALSAPEAMEGLAGHLEVVAVDEVDACFQSHPAEMELLMSAACQGHREQQQQWEQLDEQQQWKAVQVPDPPQGQTDGGAQAGGKEGQQQQQEQRGEGQRKPVVVLVGATLEESLIEHVVQQGWMSDPVTVRVGGRMRIPSGLQHRAIVVASEGDKVAAMCRQIRGDLRGQSKDAAPARVMVFAASEEQARDLSGPLRTVLWGDHKISVLLPEGTEPIKALHSFRDNKTTLLLATPAAARGLDLPAVSHVYNTELPAAATEYLHRAGRSGRIGSSVQGVVTTLVTEDEVPRLQAMATELGIQVTLQAPPPTEMPADGEAAEADVEAARRGLEDLFNLF
ncbi:hypothetical protein D9Q98_005521 [Chlorella vulgaris]|uniref:Uncharacterized protein n=1 Tax=Chlorella vulgaris TaxID=3077 RepID=A0A9D4YVY0_CHLVU|nr:hypothetical protein D9Q98_005521 [Chlorella vulgaris]